MNYSTAALKLPQDLDGVLFDVSSLYALLCSLSDRRKRRGVRYHLAVVLVALVLAKLAGETTASGIAEWVQERKTLFVETFGLKRKRMPHHNTYRRILKQAVKVAELEQLAEQFLGRLPTDGPTVQICLDGKTVRGTIASGETRGLHLLAAYCPGAGVVLCQVAVDTKTNEIGAAPQLLKMLDLKGKIVTGDALLAQRELSQLIDQAQGDYVWTLKDNHPRTREAIEQLFEPDPSLIPGFNTGSVDFQTTQQVTKAHGRLETRTLTTSQALNDTLDWPGLQQVFKLERQTILSRPGQRRQEVAYGVTSLSPAEARPERLLKLIRGHWTIENGLHYRRDVTLGEDACRVSHWPTAHALAILNNLVLALLLRYCPNAAHAQRHFAAHPDEALHLVFTRASRL
jgi:predicted transposase YbfD/YdcC